MGLSLNTFSRASSDKISFYILATLNVMKGGSGVEYIGSDLLFDHS